MTKTTTIDEKPPQTISSDPTALVTKSVYIPAVAEHAGFYGVRLTLVWVCPVCGGPRGEPFQTISYGGSLGADGWRNECGHIDKYSDVQAEAARNGLNLTPNHLKEVVQ